MRYISVCICMCVYDSLWQFSSPRHLLRSLVVSRPGSSVVVWSTSLSIVSLSLHLSPSLFVTPPKKHLAKVSSDCKTLEGESFTESSLISADLHCPSSPTVIATWVHIPLLRLLLPFLTREVVLGWIPPILGQVNPHLG